MKVTIDNVIIKAYDKLVVKSNATPTNGGKNIDLYAETIIKAFAGWIKSEANLYGNSNSKVDIKDGADIAGADVRIEAEKFNGNVKLDAKGTRKAIASKDEIEENKLSNYESVSVASGVIFRISDAAPGIAIDVYKDDSGNVQVRHVGMPGEVCTNRISGDTVTILSDVRNNKAGKLTILGADLSNNVIYGQQYIPEIVITNRTDLNLILAAIDPYNEAFTKSAINANKYNKAYLGISEITEPTILIESWGSGDVTLGGLINNERGTTTIKWTDTEKRGSLYTNNNVLMGSVQVAPLWTHKLIIENVENIGKAENDKFQVYLSLFNGQDADISVDANGNAYLQLTLTEITAVSTLTNVSKENLPGTLELDSIKAGGNLDILLPTAFRMQYLANAGAASVTIPGVLEFTTEELNLGNVSLTLSELEFYMIGVQDTIYNVYELPNGIQLYIDKDGNVYRMIGANGSTFNTEDFECKVVNGQIILKLIAYDAEINVATGELTANDPNGLDVYLKYSTAAGWYTVAGTTITVNEFELYKVVTEGEEEVYEGIDANGGALACT